MNLADIRKKAEESRKSAAVETVKVADVPADAPFAEMEAPDFSFYEELPADRFETAEENAPVEPSMDDFLVMEQPAPLPEPVPEIRDYSPESLLEPAVTAIPEEEPVQPLPAVPVSAAKRPVGYNPIETILSGRESAAACDDYADSRADSYLAEDVEEYLCFKVAHEEYAISIMAIKEIIKPRDVTEVPRVPGFISGVISLRGVIIPVMDMRLRLSLPGSAATGKERIIVVRMDSGFCGVLVDEVIQVARINKRDIEEPPAVLDGIDRDFVTGLGHFDNRLLILLNLATILDVDVH